MGWNRFDLQPHQQRIGDVLVASKLLRYGLQRIGTAPDSGVQLAPRGDRVTAALRLLDRCRAGALRWQPPDPETPPQVRFGLMLSDDKLIDHLPLVRQLLAIKPEAIGGDMEGAGRYIAAQHLPSLTEEG